jgi:hypothetical protein
MLGNQADAFFMTPMRTRVYAGGNVGNQTAMPAPREVNETATRSYVKRGNFIPLNGDGPALAGEGLDMKSPLVWVGLAGLAYFGMKLLKK